jgi:hypothetical protein
MENITQYYLKELTIEDFELHSNLCKDKIDFVNHFICLFCHCIVINPRCCTKCQKITCKKCIEVYLQDNTNCPLRCQPYTERLLTLIEKQTLNSLTLSCPVSNLCLDEMKYELLPKHITKCAYMKLKAICRGCSVAIKTSNDHHEIKEHVETCSEIAIPCEFCSTLVRRGLMPGHLDICENRIVECNFCKCELKQSMIEYHTRADCVTTVRDEYEKKIYNLTKEFNDKKKQFEEYKSIKQKEINELKEIEKKLRSQLYSRNYTVKELIAQLGAANYAEFTVDRMAVYDFEFGEFIAEWEGFVCFQRDKDKKDEGYCELRNCDYKIQYKFNIRPYVSYIDIRFKDNRFSVTLQKLSLKIGKEMKNSAVKFWFNEEKMNEFKNKYEEFIILLKEG